MFLKIRVPFFSNFDKKTLRTMMERMGCTYYKRGQVVQKFKDDAEEMKVVLSGKLAEFKKLKPAQTHGVDPD